MKQSVESCIAKGMRRILESSLGLTDSGSYHHLVTVLHMFVSELSASFRRGVRFVLFIMGFVPLSRAAVSLIIVIPPFSQVARLLSSIAVVALSDRKLKVD